MYLDKSDVADDQSAHLDVAVETTKDRVEGVEKVEYTSSAMQCCVCSGETKTCPTQQFNSRPWSQHMN